LFVIIIIVPKHTHQKHRLH